MERLVRLEDVKELLIGLESLPWEEEVDYMLGDLPVVDAVPVVHGRWVFNPRIGEHECSNCKGSISLSDDTASHPRYCPQCGAKMDGKSDEP